VQFVTANGATIPALGFGTYGMSRSDMLRMIPAALNAGFAISTRHKSIGMKLKSGSVWRASEPARISVKGNSANDNGSFDQ
jgi:2,5-diketo-D-gluconate reductase B